MAAQRKYLVNDELKQLVKQLIDGGKTVNQIAKTLGWSRYAVNRYFADLLAGVQRQSRYTPELAERVKALANEGNSDKEIAALVGLPESTLRRRMHRELERGRALLRRALRRAQLESALSGNTAMLIWLGKQYLGQAEDYAMRNETVAWWVELQRALLNARREQRAAEMQALAESAAVVQGNGQVDQ